MFKTFSHIIIRSPLQSLLNVNNTNKNDLSPIFQEGIYISSPEFWAEFNKDFASVKEADKVNQTLLKYWIRSCTRCSPFATFAGCAMVALGENDNLTLDESRKHIRCVRIDMNYLSLIVSELVHLPEIKVQLKFYCNNSLYKVANSYRYAQYSLKNNERKYALTSIAITDYIEAITEHARHGTLLGDLAIILQKTGGVSFEEAINFIDELVDAQLLISELELNVTGNEPFDILVNQMESLTGIDDLLAQFKKVQSLVKKPNEGIDHLQVIEKELKKISGVSEIPKNTLQTDLFLSSKGLCINKETIDKIIEDISDISLLSRKYFNSDTENFKKKFLEKFEDAEIPLAVALDTDMGIGYAGVQNETTGSSELIDNLFIPNSESAKNILDTVQLLAYSKYNEYLIGNTPEIEIIEKDLIDFKKRSAAYNFPNSMYVVGNLLKKDGLIDTSNFLFNLTVIGGPSAANLFGRFTHGDDELAGFTKEILIAEELGDPTSIYAEIAHLPEARIGNVLLRPVLRKYEIPYVGKSGISEEFQIPVDDIMVSVKNNSVFLRSKKYNKRIIPRLTTAHNFNNRSLPVYKFLCDLQLEGIYLPCGWDWGTLAYLKHLPRVIYKNLIIKKAQWRIEEKDIVGLPSDAERYVCYFDQFRKKYNMPSRIVYVEGENELLIDFEHIESIQLFLQYLKKYKVISL